MNASKISGGAITALVATGIFLAIVTAESTFKRNDISCKHRRIFR